MAALHIIATGGTLDKRYDPIAGTLSFGASHLPDILARCRLNTAATLTVLPLKDSLDMGEPDRLAVLAACVASGVNGAKHIVITHGTDTMPETARVLGAAGLNQTVVLTGAMIPYDIAGSDALFNLGFACAAAQTLPAGVYVVMGGQVFDWHAVRKDRVVGRFV